MKYKLIDMLGTKYLYYGVKDEVINFLDSVGYDQFDIVDIAGAHITPDIAVILNKYISNNNLKLVDSEDPNRESLLEKNYKIGALVDIGGEALPEYNNDVDISTYIADLKSSNVYSLTRYSSTKSLYVSMIVALIRPSVYIDYTDVIGTITKCLVDLLNKEDPSIIIKSTREFMYLYKGNFIHFETSVNSMLDQFFVYGIGMTNWSKLLSSELILPAYIGKRNVLSGSSNEDERSVWINVIDALLDKISNEASVVTLHKYLEGI